MTQYVRLLSNVTYLKIRFGTLPTLRTRQKFHKGRLEALLNFQTVIAELTGLPLANCSLLDEATAAAEAATMFYGSRSRAQVKAEANTLFVDENVFASTLAVINTRMIPQGIKVVVGDYKTFEFTPDVFGAIVQYPNADGSIEDYKEFIVRANAGGARVAVAADLMSLVLLTPPGEWGADVVFGSSQRFGIPMFYGGPSAAFFATKDEYKRSIPDVSSAFPKMPMDTRLTAWLCKHANNISNVKRQPPISVPPKPC